MNLQNDAVALKKYNRKSKFDSGKLQLLIMCAPVAIVVFFINYVPLFGMIVAFKNYRVDKGFLDSPWVGLKNFNFLFSSQDAWRMTRNTICLNLAFIFIGLIISLAFALMLNEITKKFFIKIYQTIMFLPYFISWVVAGYMLYAFLNMKLGIINNILTSIGMEKIQWYSESKYWPVILVGVYIWKSAGYFCIIYYSGLIGIDSEYYEAAAIDGATKFGMIRHISIPLITPLIVVMILLQIGRIFYSDFGMFWNLPMQSGMLFETTDVIDTYVFRSFRVTGQIGMASAAGFYQSIVGFILVVISNIIVKRTNPENALY